MAREICGKDHSAIRNVLEKLPESQAVIRGRHRCAGCAYDEGYKAGFKDAEKQFAQKPEREG
jgi:hypothetical protein